MTDSAKIKNWVASMVGKNRYELQAVDYCGLQDGRTLCADVYDDFLLFSIEGEGGNPLAVLIDRLTAGNVPSIAATIQNTFK